MTFRKIKFIVNDLEYKRMKNVKEQDVGIRSDVFENLIYRKSRKVRCCIFSKKGV